MNNCFKLENSKYCPEFNGHYIFKRKSISNTDEFDDVLKKFFENDNSYKKFFNDFFNCQSNDLPDFRYRRSFICNHYVSLPKFGNVNCDKQISEDKTANTIPYCYSTCMSSLDSIEEIIMDTKYKCSQTKVKSNFNSFKSSCDSWYNKNEGKDLNKDQCFLGSKEELKFCGYNNEKDKNNYCQHRKDITDSCCNSDYEVPDTIYHRDSSDTSNPKSNSREIPYLFIIIVAGISAVLTILYYIYKNKRKLEKQYQKQDNQVLNSTRLPYEDDTESSYTVKSGEENSLLYVFHEYIPKINDEIQLNVGDIVKIRKVFDDGWAYGTNVSTDCEGALPLACCMEYRSSISSMMLSYSTPSLGPVNHRDSSLYDPN